MTDKNTMLQMNRAGELLQPYLHGYTNERTKPDNPFLLGAVPYILMLLCVAIDIAFFRALFVKVSYDSPMLIWFEVAGMAFGADVTAAYAGLLAKQISQGLSREKGNLVMLVMVPVIALIVNGVLRVATISLTSADGTVDAAAVALTIIAIVTPVFTSVGNFSIGYMLYDPLAKKMQREELGLESIRDYRRRLQAIKADYECDQNSEERLDQLDQKYFLNAKKELMNDALILCGEMRVKLMEYLGDPASTNELSKSRCEAIFNRLDGELLALEKECRREEGDEGSQEKAEKERRGEKENEGSQEEPGKKTIPFSDIA